MSLPANKPNAERSVWDTLDTPIQHAGRAITLPAEPEQMPAEKAIEALKRKVADDNQPFQLHEIIDAYPHDGAVAFVRAMTKLYGWASPQTVMTFFGPQHPQMLSVKTGVHNEDVIQCPLGQFKLPNVDNPVNATFWQDSKGRPNFLIHGQFKKKDRHVLLELANETRRFVREQSIYRGKAIRLGVDEIGGLDMNDAPVFLDVTNIKASDLMFDKPVKEQIDTNILVPIRNTAKCREYNIPLKRGVLLEGPYGTGKSLAGRLTAAEAERNGWTFILIDKVQGLRVALEFARRYAPAVVFAEDIDRIMTERDDAANDLINTIDGVVSKTDEIMVVLTTNFAEKLDPVILRPGRFDAVISVRAPGPDTVERLVRFYGNGLLSKDETLVNTGAALAGQIPATIRECVERAKLGMIGRGDVVLKDGDIVVAAETMKNHLALLNRKPDTKTPAELLAEGLRGVLGAEVTLGEGVDGDHMLGLVAQGATHAKRTYGKLSNIEERLSMAADAASQPNPDVLRKLDRIIEKVTDVQDRL